MAYKLNGEYLSPNSPFSTGGVNYPSNWLQLSSESERSAIGISTVADEETYDSVFYTSPGAAKPLADLKANFIQKQKDYAASLIQETDWMVIRAAGGGTAVSSDTTTYRAAVRTKSNEREAQITACSNVAALQNLLASPEGTTEGLKAWPTKP